MAKHERCRYCKKQIRWEATRDRGKAIPIDAEPSPAGTVILIAFDGATKAVVLGKAALEALEAGTPRYVAHFATCTKNPRKKKPATATDRGASTTALVVGALAALIVVASVFVATRPGHHHREPGTFRPVVVTSTVAPPAESPSTSVGFPSIVCPDGTGHLVFTGPAESRIVPGCKP